MIEDGIDHRELVLTGEASYRAARKPKAYRKAQEETQGRPKRCEVADDSVVVMKSRPEKAGNRLEDKTGMTCGSVRRGQTYSKGRLVAEGGSSF